MYVITLTEHLLQRNIDCTLCCYPNSKIYYEAETKQIPMTISKSKSYFHPVEIYKLSSHIKKNKYDVIHSHCSKDLWTIVPAMNLLKTKTPLLFTKQIGSFIIKKDFLHKNIYARVNRATVISTVIKNNLIETCPIDKDKVSIIFNGINADVFDPVKVDRMKVRKEFSLAEGEIVIGMSARFTKGKGHEELLRAAKELNEKYTHLKFLLVGESSYGENTYGEKIKNMVVELGIEDKVIFTGFRKDMPDVYAAMDIFAFPSHAEAFGLALTEAMAMEKPCVASNSDGILDIIDDGKNGLFFNNKNHHSLKEKLEQLITSKSERERLGKAARNTVLENFELQRNITEFVQLYKSLLN